MTTTGNFTLGQVAEFGLIDL